jgi:hypothetical protein
VLVALPCCFSSFIGGYDCQCKFINVGASRLFGKRGFPIDPWTFSERGDQRYSLLKRSHLDLILSQRLACRRKQRPSHRSNTLNSDDRKILEPHSQTTSLDTSITLTLMVRTELKVDKHSHLRQLVDEFHRHHTPYKVLTLKGSADRR